MSLENIDDALGIKKSDNDMRVLPTVPLVDEEVSETQIKRFESQLPAIGGTAKQDDFDQVRGGLKRAIDTLTDNLEEILVIARTSESPRAFEVAGQYMEKLTSLSKALMDLHKDTAGPKQEAEVINNNQFVFQGSSLELLDIIKGQNGLSGQYEKVPE